jgi:diguanylate cyclase (GGDEF)-like protein
MGAIVLNSRQRRAALGLAVLGNWLPLLIATLDDWDTHPTVFFVGAAIGAIAPIGVTLTAPSMKWLRWLFAYGGLFGLTMLQAHTGGVSSQYAVLLVMATIWFGVMATQREMLVGLGVMAACCIGPMLIFGSPAYPVDWPQAVILVVVIAAVMGTLSMLSAESQRLTRRLRHEASHDPLTKVLNRRGWEQESARDAARAGRSGESLTVVLLDLDRLKGINDSLGHDAGDRILCDTAERVATAFRGVDVIARVGGDEFAVLLTGATPDDAFGAVERLRAATPEDASFSAGIAVAAADESPEELMRRADLALYEAKSDGRGRAKLAPLPVRQAPAN